MFNLLTFTALVQQFAAAAQATAGQILDFSIGSVLRALAEGTASLALWMQWLIVVLAGNIRAATASGSNLDSWMADFGITRLQAVSATGTVTFSRYTPTASAFIPVLAQVKTADGLTSFQVIADTTQTYWNAGLNGYLIPAAIASGAVTVQAITSGTSGNVLAGQIALLATGISGVDTVNNALAFTNGYAAETDAALRIRFVAYFATLSRATLAAVGYAVSIVKSGLTYTIQQNVLANGTAQTGNFVVTVDDGSGTPPSSLLSLIATSVDGYRPVGTTFNIVAPTVVTVAVSYVLTVAAPGVKATVDAETAVAVAAYLNSLPMGALVAYFQISRVIFAADPTITNIGSLTLNGATSDITIAAGQVAKAGTITAA